MCQSELDRLVAAATGESLAAVRHLGFSLADPLRVDFDPEPADGQPYLDWDHVDRRRYAELAVH